MLLRPHFLLPTRFLRTYVIQPPPRPHFLLLDLNIWAREDFLRTYLDRLYARTLVGIIRQGVCIGYKGPDKFVISKTLVSAEDDPTTLMADLLAQRAHNRLKLVNSDPSQRFICSPLGLVPKSGGSWRRINHLSFPPGASANDHIPAEWGALESISPLMKLSLQ